MDNRAIGVFDSGLGGLTAVRELRALMPGETIIYLGDTGRVPYGPRSKETIAKYTKQDAEFLLGFDIKVMMAACNTVSSTSFDVLERVCNVPVYGVVEPPARAAAAATKNGKIGVIGTEATVRSGAYKRTLNSLSDDLEVFSVACPLFVPLVENGRTSSEDIAALTIASEYLSPLADNGIDTLILGCTHYPLMSGVISKVLGPEVCLIDSGTEAAKKVAHDLCENRMCSIGKESCIKYFVTDSIFEFSKVASLFLGTDVKGFVEQIVLE